MGATHGKSGKSRLALFEMLKADPPFPDIDDRGDLIDTMQDIGWGLSTGMGASQLPSHEIKAWAEMSGEDLTPWEFRVIRRMSSAYVSGMSAEAAPYEPVMVKIALASAGMVMD